MMKKVKRKKAYYSISAVAEMFTIHQQTIRLYEKEGLISPKRSEGNTRLFSEEDVEQLEEVIYLTHQLGINLAGVQMILKLQKKMQKMQTDMNKLFEDTHQELEREVDQSKAIIKQSVQELSKLKSLPEKEIEGEGWEIEYEEE
ncbi:TPA: MerR family transcriptional regulator [Candidatus Dependentiae bacterium]|nr:MAG: Transcriptional regulator (MerR family) [candidate division TM6 bacterium GW2011_GWF2_36_131]KKQ02373.1 MAG: Transcriptional regulator (MerR family) [candidate division TM6 bacterium GW2011_GWE2_36_25]KKQ18652.1 MAG: Transcriptional regulator (MerR family) [candidate division TM6 bacterium GW2011_GWA2_36_9]HBR70970.1 MerR family transcriptional regulator [Candidatus Dependentiae bacterium]HCU00585.1 MerR family transcriptional regulator [Candidatus Dependentiae bacterium]